jgi:hypothetical protein
VAGAPARGPVGAAGATEEVGAPTDTATVAGGLADAAVAAGGVTGAAVAADGPAGNTVTAGGEASGVSWRPGRSSGSAIAHTVSAAAVLVSRRHPGASFQRLESPLDELFACEGLVRTAGWLDGSVVDMAHTCAEGVAFEAAGAISALTPVSS